MIAEEVKGRYATRMRDEMSKTNAAGLRGKAQGIMSCLGTDTNLSVAGKSRLASSYLPETGACSEADMCNEPGVSQI
jgi:hypothetical protein